MKCRLTEKRNMTIMLIVGLTLIAIGAPAGYLLPEEMHLATRIAGFASGAGLALTVMAAAVLLRRARLGEKRARDSELTMSDERGVAVAYKAQSAMAIAAVFALVIIDVVALVRGDGFYTCVVCVLLAVVALVKLVAWYVYNKKM